MTIKVSAKKLLESGAHFGHQSKRWNSKMAPYLHGIKDGVHVFDLIKTQELLEKALDRLELAAKNGEDILIVGTKKQAKEKVLEIAQDVGVSFVSERWLGGTLTNFEQIERSIKKLSDMKEKRESGEFNQFTKKERVLIDREIARLERFFGGMAGLSKTPDLLVIIDIKREHTVVKEAIQKQVEMIALVDSNSDPTPIDFPIPMNDDASRAIEYVLELIGEAIESGKSKKSKAKASKKSKSKDK